MNSVIRDSVLLLVGKVSWIGFNRNSAGSLASLQMKLNNHIKTGNAGKLKKYLALCIQSWPEFSQCPVNRCLIDDAIQVIEMSTPW